MGTEPITLTAPETQLVEHVVDGKLLDFAGSEAVDEDAMRTWGDDRTIRAEVIREIMRGRLAPASDPRGLRLRGAKIAGRLDLVRIHSDVALQLYHCYLDKGVDARYAHVPSLVLAGCRLAHPSQPPLDASGLSTAQLALDDATITGSTEHGAVRLLRARIEGSLGCQGAAVRNNSGPALDADGLLVDRNIYLRAGFFAVGASKEGAVRLVGARINGDLDCSAATMSNDAGTAFVADGMHIEQTVALRNQFRATGVGEGGAVRLVGARIGGQLSCVGAVLHNETGPTLRADRLKVGNDIFLTQGFKATGSSPSGTVMIPGAQIAGDLDCAGATLNNRSGPALVADGLQVDGDVLLREGFDATGSDVHGTVRLSDARIAGKLACDDARISNTAGPALEADRVQVDQGVFLVNGLDATGAGEYGTIRLSSARIGGQLQCVGATLLNKSGPAIDADGLQVDQNIVLAEGFSAVGNGEDGAVRMLGARIAGQLEFLDASLRSNSGPAISADRVRVEQNLVLADGFTATGTGAYGAVRLSGVQIGGQLSCLRANLNNDSGPALDASELQVGGSALFSSGFRAAGAEPVTIDLSGARVAGRLQLTPGKVENNSNAQSLFSLDGLAYSGLPVTSQKGGWLGLIRNATPAYAAQPYQQFAASHRAAGSDTQVRKVLIAQRRDQFDRRALTGRGARAWACITRVTLGYGYRPWLALLWLAGVVALTGVLTLALGDRGALGHSSATHADSRCSTVDQVGVALEMSLPLIDTGAQDRCTPTDSASGHFLIVAGWILQLFAWAFATLFVAGFTGAVRKT